MVGHNSRSDYMHIYGWAVHFEISISPLSLPDSWVANWGVAFIHFSSELLCGHIRVFLIVYIRNMEIILSSCRKMRLEGLLGPPNQTYNVSLIMTWLGRDYSISWRTGFWFILSDFLFYGFLYRWIMFLVCQTYNVSLIMTWLAPDYSIS